LNENINLHLFQLEGKKEFGTKKMLKEDFEYGKVCFMGSFYSNIFLLKCTEMKLYNPTISKDK